MHESGYWICFSVGWDHARPRGRRWDALPISVQPTDGLDVPDIAEMVRGRPGRLIVWGVWSPQTGWSMTGQQGDGRLAERFATASFGEQGPFRAAVNLGVATAMRLCLGLTPQDRDPFPAPGAN